jgi:putative transposase
MGRARHFKKGSGVLREGIAVKYDFIHSHQEQFTVAAMCRVFKVSSSGFYESRNRSPSKRAQANVRLLGEICRVHRECREAYGAKKTWVALNRHGIACGKHRVARLRKAQGIEARRKRRFRVTIEHHTTATAAPDLVRRNFSASLPNAIWVGDMTFIRTRQGWLHLAVLLDLFSRRVVGWAMDAQPRQELAQRALAMALAHRQPASGLIHHTDRGSPYSATQYRQQLAAQGICPSMSGMKSAYDNAVAESFFSTLKNELEHHSDFATRDEARTAIFDYIECFYNRKRIHETLGYRTPEEVEREWGSSLLTCPENAG